MEATPLDQIGDRPRERDASALMAGQTERLLAVATRAFLLIFAGGHRVHLEPVVGVDAPRAHAAVMAISAVFFAVAVAAKATVVARDQLVPLDPIRAVPRVMEPTGGDSGPALKLTLIMPLGSVRWQVGTPSARDPRRARALDGN